MATPISSIPAGLKPSSFNPDQRSLLDIGSKEAPDCNASDFSEQTEISGSEIRAQLLGTIQTCPVSFQRDWVQTGLNACGQSALTLLADNCKTRSLK